MYSCMPSLLSSVDLPSPHPSTPCLLQVREEIGDAKTEMHDALIRFFFKKSPLKSKML